MSKTRTEAAWSVALGGSKRKAVDGLWNSEKVLGKKVKVESAAAGYNACGNALARVTRDKSEQGPHGNLDACCNVMFVAAVSR